MSIGSDERTAIDQRTNTGMMTDGEMIIFWVTTKGITPQNMTGEEGKDDTLSSRGTIRTGITQATKVGISNGMSTDRQNVSIVGG